MVSAETSLSPMPQSFRQRFLHFIPRADDLVPSALPKLKEVFWGSGTRGMRKDTRIWITVIFFFSFRMMLGPRSRGLLTPRHPKYESWKTTRVDVRRALYVMALEHASSWPSRWRTGRPARLLLDVLRRSE